MKKMTKFFLIVIPLFFQNVGVFAQGVIFRELSLHDAIQASVQEKKYIFLDCYTTWCGPCKIMANTVFTLEEAGDYFNERFVCVKTDMGKGEGRLIGKKYGVDAYPTFLIINSNGDLIHKVVGASSLNDLVKNIEYGLNKRTLARLDSLYGIGKLGREEQMAYWKLLIASGGDTRAQEVGDNLWRNLREEDKLNLMYWPLLESRGALLDSEEVKFVLANRKCLEQEVGKDEIEYFVYNACLQELKLMILNRLPERKHDNVLNIQDLIKSNYVPRQDALLKICELIVAQGKHDYDTFLNILEASLDELNDLEKDFVFEGARLMALSNNKEYNKKLGEIAFRASELTKDGVVKNNLRAIGSMCRRMGSTGVYWENFKTLEAVLTQAGMERKYVFLYCYKDGQTSQLVDEKLFMREEIGEYLNHHFINYKVNIEEGMGRWISKMYEIKISNAMLVLDSSGDVRHRVSSGQNNDFIKSMNETFDDNKALGALEAKYEVGERSPEIMVNYLTILQKINDPRVTRVAGELFRLLDDDQRISSEFWFLFNPQLSEANPEIKDYLLSNFQKFRDVIGTEKVDQIVINQIYSDLVSPLYNVNSEVSIDYINDIIKFVEQQDFQNSGELLGFAKIAKLYKKKIYNAGAYKKASKDLKPERIPFTDLYSNITMLAPEKIGEWNAWGKEIMKSLTDTGLITWYSKLLRL